MWLRFLVVMLMQQQLTPVWASGLQDITSCNPFESNSKCSPNLAFASNLIYDFSKVDTNADLDDFWIVSASTVGPDRQIDIDSSRDEAVINVWNEKGNAPTLTSKKYLLFGKASVEVEAAKGKGVVTTLMLKSDGGDVLAWNLFGAQETQAQRSYHSHSDSNKSYYNNNTFDLADSITTNFHTYTVEWTDMRITFFINGERQETLYVGDVPPEKWPQTPMQVKIGVWTDGDARWDDGVPYHASVRRVVIDDYMGGCEQVDSDTDLTYSYNSDLHSWRDVVVKGCKKRLAPGALVPLEPSTTHNLPSTQSGSTSSHSHPPLAATDSDSPTSGATRTTAAPTGSSSSSSSSSEAPSSTDDPEAPEQGSQNGVGRTDRPATLLTGFILLCWAFLS